MDRPAQPPGSMSRRRFVRAAAGLGLTVAGGTLLGGCSGQTAPFFSLAEGTQLETTRIRFSQIPGVCVGPQYVAPDLLRAEGFTDVEYVQFATTNPYPGF